MMFRKTLLPVVLAAAAGTATADDYTYIAGGWQFGRIDNAKDMNTLLNINSNWLSRSYGTEKQLKRGFYLNGGYGFDNNLFLDIRVNYMNNRDFSIKENVLGVGYHYGLSDSTDLYALAGVSHHGLSDGGLFFARDKDFHSATGEAGLKIRLTPDISVSSALRLANYDGQAYYGARLGSAYALTQHLSVEAGYQYHHWKVSHQAGTMGLRYTF